MPESFTALLVAIVAVLPGALYVLCFERAVGGHLGVNLSDRLTRFVVISALYHAFLAPVTFQLYRRYVVTEPLAEASHIPWLVWIAGLAYLVVPCAAGSLVGASVSTNHPLVRPFAGRAPQPRAWDFLWGAKPEVTVRLRLKSGSWVAGIYSETPDGRRPYAAGYPEPGDLYLPRTVAVDAETGAFLFGDDGLPAIEHAGILVRWDEVEYLVVDP